MQKINESIIVAAHPDDEILWFSSILDQVDKIVLCFLEVKSNPQWTKGRQQSLTQYPLKNIQNLGIKESEIFEGINWKYPVPTDYGFKVTESGYSDELYVKNFSNLRTKLREHLKDHRNVFTHNPWGEYGHVEHVQVYRAVKSLQEELGFNLWFSNYCSNKTYELMLELLNRRSPTQFTLPTNKELALNIADIYKKNGCWTWYDDFQWLENETFIQNWESSEKTRLFGSSLPVNLINIWIRPRKHSKFQTFALKVCKKFSRMLD